jgi:Protein of unknown function (DUF2510)
VKREPGWYKDPYFRNQERYWDGDVWSQETRKPAAIDAGAPDTAKPAAAAQSMEGTASPSADPASPPADTASAMLGAPVPTQPTKETPATATPPKGGGKEKSGAPQSTARTGSSGTGADAGDASRPVPLGTIIAPGPPTTKPGQGTPGGRRGLLIAFVVVLVLIFAGVGFFLTRGSGGAEGTSGGSGSGSGSGATASQSGVTAAVQKSLQHGTVDATVNVTVSTTKGSAPQKILSGTGGFDLKNQAGTMSLTAPGSPASDPATQIVFVGPSVYVNLGSHLSSLIPGKTWITATAAQLGSSASGLGPGISSFEQLLGNPATLVQQLNTSGARFTSLGSSTFGGAQVQRYLVKFSPVQQTTTTGLTGSSTGATAGAHAGEVLYVSSKGVIKAIVIPDIVSSNGQSFNESITIAFSHYGQAVAITPPPAAEIATLAQYVAAAGQTGPGSAPGGLVTSPSPTPQVRN